MDKFKLACKNDILYEKLITSVRSGFLESEIYKKDIFLPTDAKQSKYIIRVVLINLARRKDKWNFLNKTNIETNFLDQNDQVYLLEIKFIQFDMNAVI